MSAVDHAIERLKSVFAPPETDNPNAFIAELRIALDGLSPDALADGVTAIIKSRKARSFPSIGDVRQACIDALPRSPAADPRKFVDAIEEREKRDREAIRMLAGYPQIDRLVQQGKHAVMYDFVREHGRFPDRTELAGLGNTWSRVEAKLSDLPDAGFAAVIVADMRKAILARRAELARKINEARAMEAAQ